MSSRLERLVIKPTSIGKPIIEAYSSTSDKPILFQRLDGELIAKGLAKRKIEAGGQFHLEDHRQETVSIAVACLATLQEPQNLAA